MARPQPFRRQVPPRTAKRRLKVTLSMSVAETCLANQGGGYSPTIVTISNDMTRLGVRTESCGKLGIRHTHHNRTFEDGFLSPLSVLDLLLQVANSPSMTRFGNHTKFIRQNDNSPHIGHCRRSLCANKWELILSGYCIST